MRKAKLIFTLLIIAIAFCVCFAACSKIENNIQKQNEVVSRFGDGIVVLESQAAPTTATEYKSEPRVRAKVNVDARLSGYHVTGIYLPAGETLTIDVSTTRAEYGYSVIISNFSGGTRVTKQITAARTVLDSKDAPLGGVVEILVPEIAAQNTSASFNMRIDGGIVMPYYRLGRDNLDQIEKGGGDYAVLDCVDARFYVPRDIMFDGEGACVIKDDIYDSLLWWESAISFLNQTLGIPADSTEYNSAVILGSYGEKMTYDENRRAITADNYYFDSILKYDNLVRGKAWDLLYAICEHKVSISENFSDTVSDTMIVDILCSIDSVVMTKTIDEDDGDWQWLANPYTCLSRTLELLDVPALERPATYEGDLLRAFFINIMHSFGLDKTINIITAYGQLASSRPSNDTLALIISEELNADVSLYCEKFGLTLSQSTKNKMSGNVKFIPVQTKFTAGNDDQYNTGYTVAMGERAVFDFEENTVSMADGWDIVGVRGDDKLWSASEGIYYYTPSTDKLRDEFQIQLRNGETNVTLYGKLNVLITVATYKIYERWTFDNTSAALDEAISAYQKRTPDFVGSIDFAGIDLSSEVDPNLYVLTVTEGCIKVPESGKYRIYLRNHGLCRVEFGVSKYMMSMFNSPIPVPEFTRYQSAELDLDENKIYDYKLYLLSTKGESDAALGIKYIEDKDVEDNDLNIDVIDENYLIYKGLDRSDIVKFVPPVIYPTGYGLKEAFYQTHDLQTSNFISYPKAAVGKGIDLAFDALTATSSYYSAAQFTNRYEFVIGFEKALRMEYVMLNVRSETVGSNVEIFVSNSEDFSEQVKLSLSGETLAGGDNYMLFQSKTYKYIKIILLSEQNFACSINDLKIGQYFESSSIVPNTSSMLSYMGGWTDVGEYVSVNGSVSQSVNNSSIYAFTALCRQVCLYGVKDSKYGKMDVYVDGKYHSTVDLQSESTLTDQLLFAIDFDTYTEHSVKVMPASKEDMINLDYISYIPVEVEEIKSIGGVLYYVLIIPGVIAVALICAALADLHSKKKVKKAAKASAAK